MDLYWGHIQQGSSAPVLPTIVYGMLYNWYAAVDANIAPAGWHIPSCFDAGNLRQYLDSTGSFSSNIAGGYMKETGLTYWTSPNTGATNTTGFNGRGSGYRDASTGVFWEFKNRFYMWSPYAPYESANSKIMSTLYYNTVTFNAFKANDGYPNIGPKAGCSIRLIKNDSVNPGTVTDYDGNVYPTVLIGTQVWTALNWACTHYNNGVAIPEVTTNATWAGLSTGARCYYNNNIANI